MPQTEVDVLSVVQAAEELGLSPRAVRHRIKVGTITATKLGDHTASYVIRRSEVDRIKKDQAA